MSKFKFGDAVKVRSASWQMQVVGVDVDDSGEEVHCQWLHNGVELTRAFPASMLVLWDGPTLVEE